jgi:hypothetical protein
MEKNPGLIFENFVFWVKNNLFFDADPGSCQPWIREELTLVVFEPMPPPGSLG